MSSQKGVTANRISVDDESRTQRPKFEGRHRNSLIDTLLAPQVRFALLKGQPGSGKTTLALDLLLIRQRHVHFYQVIAQAGDHSKFGSSPSLCRRG